MLPSSDPTKNYAYAEGPFSDYFVKDHNMCYGWYEFYHKNRLEKDGFIFPDGSLKFEFYVKKQNYQKRLKAAEVEIEVQKKQISYN